MFFEEETAPSLLDAGTHFSQVFSETAIAADPGLAAAVSGGAILSQPLQWVLDTVGGLICATFSQQAFLRQHPDPAYAVSSLADETSPTITNALPAETSPEVAPAKESSLPHQASQASWEVKEAVLQMVPRVESSLPTPAKSAGSQPPARLEVSSAQPARLQTAATLEPSQTTATGTATKTKPCVPAPCQRSRIFGSRRSSR